MTTRTLTVLFVAAALATPAFSADSEAPVEQPPQPVAAPETPDHQHDASTDAMARAEALYQRMLSDAADRAAEAHAKQQDALANAMSQSAEANTTYRNTVTVVLIIVGFGGLAFSILVWVVERASLGHRKKQLDEMLGEVQVLTKQADAHAGAAATAMSAAETATEELRDVAATIHNNIAGTYLELPSRRPDSALLFLVNAVETADLACRDFSEVIEPLNAWIAIATRGKFVPMEGQWVNSAIQDTWRTLQTVELRRTEPEFTVAAHAARELIRALLGADSLKKVLAGESDVVAHPEPPKPKDNGQGDAASSKG